MVVVCPCCSNRVLLWLSTRHDCPAWSKPRWPHRYLHKWLDIANAVVYRVASSSQHRIVFSPFLASHVRPLAISFSGRASVSCLAHHTISATNRGGWCSIYCGAAVAIALHRSCDRCCSRVFQHCCSCASCGRPMGATLVATVRSRAHPRSVTVASICHHHAAALARLDHGSICCCWVVLVYQLRSSSRAWRPCKIHH